METEIRFLALALTMVGIGFCASVLMLLLREVTDDIYPKGLAPRWYARLIGVAIGLFIVGAVDLVVWVARNA